VAPSFRGVDGGFGQSPAHSSCSNWQLRFINNSNTEIVRITFAPPAGTSAFPRGQPPDPVTRPKHPAEKPVPIVISVSLPPYGGQPCGPRARCIACRGPAGEEADVLATGWPGAAPGAHQAVVEAEEIQSLASLHRCTIRVFEAFETQHSEEQCFVEAFGEVEDDWPDTVLAKGLAVLDGHFVTRVVEPGDAPNRTRVVEALFVTPDLDSADCMPISRPYVAQVEWRDDEELREVVPFLTPTLDRYAAELFAAVVEGGDPNRILSHFPVTASRATEAAAR